MPTQKRAAPKKSRRASSTQSDSVGEAIRVSELLEALQRANAGKPIRVPRDVHPDVARVFQELKTLVRRAAPADGAVVSQANFSKSIETLADANESILDWVERVHERLVQAPLEATTSWKQVTNSLQRAAESMTVISAETNALAVWGTNLQTKNERTHEILLGKVIEQWSSVGGQFLEFARQMEQTAIVQEQSLRRLGDALDKLERDPSPKPVRRK